MKTFRLESLCCSNSKVEMQNAKTLDRRVLIGWKSVRIVDFLDAEDAEKRRIRKVMLYFSTLIALLSLLCVQKLFEMKK